MKEFFKKITGISAKEEQLRLRKEEEDRAKAEEEKQRIAAKRKENAIARKAAKEEKLRKEKEAEALLTPKELATKRGEPWVDVIGFKVNPDDIRFGFFEIDWNDHWVLKLKQEGYGADGDPDDEIIARWYRDILLSAAAEEGVDMTDRAMGTIDIRKVNMNKKEDK